MNYENLRVNARFSMGLGRYTVLKVAPGKVLCKSWGFNKWITFKEMEQQKAFVESWGDQEC